MYATPDSRSFCPRRKVIRSSGSLSSQIPPGEYAFSSLVCFPSASVDQHYEDLENNWRDEQNKRYTEFVKISQATMDEIAKSNEELQSEFKFAIEQCSQKVYEDLQDKFKEYTGK